MDISSLLLKTADVTRGRVDRQDTFRDFLAFCACTLSNRTDPVHLKTRTEQLERLSKNYRPQELAAFMTAFVQLSNKIIQNVQSGIYTDVFGPVFQQLHPKSGPLKQDFTPPSIGSLVARLSFQGIVPSDKGYATCMEPTCGSGILCLQGVQTFVDHGYNPCEQIVLQASDLDSQCVHMTYIQLSLYCVPAVVIRGDVITLEEYDRWYTPLYIWRNWVWREPMPFRPGRNKSDELLKMVCEPWYAKTRLLESLIKKGSMDCKSE